MLLFFFLLFFSCSISAQDRNAVRVGVGVNVRNSRPDNGTLEVGPSLFVEYGREINRYLSIAANVHTDMNEYGDFANLHALGVSVRGIVTPLPKWFRWIKIGVGATYEYRKDIYGINPKSGDGSGIKGYRQHTSHYWGIDFPLRAYFIDNSRYELYAFYELKTLFAENRYFWNYSNGGAAFGVKF